MKKVFLTILLCLAIALPFNGIVKADSKDDNKINIYLFRGYGCGYCHRFLEFLDSIDNEYGKYYNLVSYEVWYDQANYNLMTDISSFLLSKNIIDREVGGVPFIIIGNQVFPGYASNYDDSIKKAIKSLYDTKKSERYDVFTEYQKSLADDEKIDLSTYVTMNTDDVWKQEQIGKYSVEEKADDNQNTADTSAYKSSSKDLNPWVHVAIEFAIVLVATCSVIYVIHSQNKTLYKKLVSVESQIKDLEKKNEKVVSEKKETKKTTKK